MTKKKLSPFYSLANLERLLKIDRNFLRYLSRKAGHHYAPYDIQEIKFDGEIKWRHIANPSQELKKIQKRIYLSILKKQMTLLPSGIVGGVYGRSLTDNASPHQHQEMVCTIDIKNCFPSTTNLMVIKAFRVIGCGTDVAEILTRLTTFQRQLPQGSPTSNALCNLCLLPLFLAIKKIADLKNIAFTLYVDDITISGDALSVQNSILEIIRTIQKYGYAVSHRKILKMPSNRPQMVTGNIVNKKINITHKKIEEVRYQILRSQKTRQKFTESEFASIMGKINYIKSVDEEKGLRLVDLAEIFLPKIFAPKENKDKLVTRKCRHHKHVTNKKPLNLQKIARVGISTDLSLPTHS